MSIESSKKIAYLILAHQDPIHLERLTKAIDYKAHIFIHLDRKTDIEKYEHIASKSTVEFIPTRHKVYWGGLSMVNAVLELIKSALASGREKYSHLVLLSGADYPIRPIEDFYNFLRKHSGKQLIKVTTLRNSPPPGELRATRYWFLDPLQPLFDDRFITRYLEKFLQYLKLERKPPANMLLAWGSGNWVITPECASYIVKYVEKNPSFYRFYKYAHCVDEQFFHTIIANSPFLEATESIYYNFKRPYELSNITLNFLGRGFDENDYSFLEDLSLNRKPTIDRVAGDMVKRDVLRDSLDYSNYFFVRKFTTKKSSKLLDLIDKNLLYR